MEMPELPMKITGIVTMQLHKEGTIPVNKINQSDGTIDD